MYKQSPITFNETNNYIDQESGNLKQVITKKGKKTKRANTFANSSVNAARIMQQA